jgi:hypothetical protein
VHPSLGRALSSSPTLAPRFGCTFLHERCDTRAPRLEPRSTPPIPSRPTRPVTSLNEIECLGRLRTGVQRAKADLWIIAAIFVIGGIVTLIRGAVLYFIVLVIIGLLIGRGA